MGVAVVPAHALPIVQLRIVVRAGSGYAAPGVGDFTAEMLKEGGTRALSSTELVRRVETLGSDLTIQSDFDATTLGMAVTKDHLAEALSLLSQVVREPRFDDGELKKLKARATDEAEDAARSSGAWAAHRILFHALYPPGHPYATAGLVPSEIARVDGARIRAFYRRFYVPRAAELVVAGDVELEAVRAAAEAALGKWTGGEPPKIAFPPPAPPPAKTRVILSNRPKSAQSDVYVVSLAPERRAPSWAALRVADQILGGGVASRLFLDVREQRSLAYRTGAQILELSHGRQPLVVSAGTQTAKTAEAVAGLLDGLAKMTSSPPTPAETRTAARYLGDVFAIRMETIGSIANMVVTQDVLGLPDGYWDAYRAELRAVDAAGARAASEELFGGAGGARLVVVSGDADAVGPELTRFGEVTVVDPENEMKEVRRMSAR
jgi:predicted Zn-dependent peptidase